VQTIVARHQDREALLPAEIDDHALPYFCDWLTEHVHLVEITATAEEDAYTIFETMNDRGLSLTPLDMLKGYLLAHINDPAKRNLAAKGWRERIEALRKIGKDEDASAVKAWLRAQHAKTVRVRGQVHHRAPRALDGPHRRRPFVARQVVHHHDVARPQRRHQHLLDVRHEQVAVHRPVDHHRGHQPVGPQRRHERRRLPVPVRDRVDHPVPDRRPAVPPGHLRVRPGLVEEHQRPRVNPGIRAAWAARFSFTSGRSCSAARITVF
jgi:hypothetical protein